MIYNYIYHVSREVPASNTPMGQWREDATKGKEVGIMKGKGVGGG